MLDETLTIRKILPSESSKLARFLYEAIYIQEGMEAPAESVIYEPSIYHYIDGFGTQPDDHGFVAEYNGELIGAAWVRLLSGKLKGYGNVDDTTPEHAISLLPEYRGKGVGFRLMGAFVNYLDELGYAQTSLSVNKENYAKNYTKKLALLL